MEANLNNYQAFCLFGQKCTCPVGSVVFWQQSVVHPFRSSDGLAGYEYYQLNVNKTFTQMEYNCTWDSFDIPQDVYSERFTHLIEYT